MAAWRQRLEKHLFGAARARAESIKIELKGSEEAFPRPSEALSLPEQYQKESKYIKLSKEEGYNDVRLLEILRLFAEEVVKAWLYWYAGGIARNRRYEKHVMVSRRTRRHEMMACARINYAPDARYSEIMRPRIHQMKPIRKSEAIIGGGMRGVETKLCCQPRRHRKPAKIT